MSEEYYKARISELSRELEAAHAELGQYGADIKMLEDRLEGFKEELLEWISHNSGCSGFEPWSTVVVEELEEFIGNWKERK